MTRVSVRPGLAIARLGLAQPLAIARPGLAQPLAIAHVSDFVSSLVLPFLSAFCLSSPRLLPPSPPPPPPPLPPRPFPSSPLPPPQGASLCPSSRPLPRGRAPKRSAGSSLKREDAPLTHLR